MTYLHYITTCWGLDNQGSFFMRNSQVIHENIVSESYTKDIEEQAITRKENSQLLIERNI